jgi:NADPH:quinone reductase-like Zn-dependent oxidoreductase
LATGATVIATTSSDEKAEKLKELGAQHVINYRETPEWGKAVRQITNGQGAEVIVEVGGAQTLGESFRAVSLAGTIAVIGVLSGIKSELNVAPIVMNAIHMIGVAVGNRTQFQAMLDAVNASKIVPVVDDEIFPLADIKDAMAYMKSGQHIGKIGLTF